jgi:hypothetical protein
MEHLVHLAVGKPNDKRLERLPPNELAKRFHGHVDAS